jgi:uncharacterized protein YuzE
MKKILALVLALTLVLGTFSFAAAAPKDVAGTDCEEAVARLGALGIIVGYPDGTFRPDQPVTRAEFSKIIVAALGIGEAAQYAAGVTRFPDVAADHWASGYINVAVDVGVIVGYPDGTFLPENQVTYAEAIKMIVAALGYTPKAEALGGYPGGYLAVAAEEGITDGVNVIGSLSANRGAIAMMVDNSLEVDLMEQVSYGDSPRWETVDKTLLKNKLGVEEVEGVVTAISKTAKLDENEFELDDDEIYEMAIDINTESLFLKEVKILHKNEKVVWVNVETSEKDIVFDTVITGGDNDDEQVELKVADKTYAWLDDDIRYATIYINYEEYTGSGKTARDLEGMYGYFIFDGKEIMAANLFDFEDGDRGFVTDVYRDEIEYIDLYQAEEQLLVLDDYDEVYVYNKDFTRADLDDIDEDTVIFYWENDDDELFVMVVNETVEGEVTRLRANRVTIDGTNYDTTAEASIISVNEGKDFEKLDDVTDFDIMDEDVVLYLDLNGEIAALVTDAKATSDSLYGIATWIYTGRSPSIAVFTTEEKEVEYYFEERTDAVVFIDDYPNDNETVWAIKYKLNSDREIADGSIEIIAAIDDGGFEFDFDYPDGKVDGTVTTVRKSADRKYVEGNGRTYYIGTDTVIMKALDDGELDPEVIDYDTLVDMAIATSVGEAIIFGEPGRTAKMIVFLNENFEGRKDDVYFGVVTDAPWKVGSDWFVEMDIFGEGKDEYKLKASNQVKEGELIAFYLDNSDKVNDTVCGIVYQNSTDARIIVGTVYGRDGSYIELGNAGSNSGDYRVASGAVLYQLDGDELNLNKYDLDGTIRLTRIREGDKIALLYDLKEKEVVAAIVAPKE